MGGESVLTLPVAGKAHTPARPSPPSSSPPPPPPLPATTRDLIKRRSSICLIVRGSGTVCWFPGHTRVVYAVAGRGQHPARQVVGEQADRGQQIRPADRHGVVMGSAHAGAVAPRRARRALRGYVGSFSIPPLSKNGGVGRWLPENTAQLPVPFGGDANGVDDWRSRLDEREWWARLALSDMSAIGT